jgi:glyoxylase-like metal-dependent hydrolase (beta-lactamase superfamily II)
VDRHAWEQPAVDVAAPGVYRIPLPLPGDGLRAVNVYALPDGEQVVLIDGGWALAEARERLASGLDSIGYGLADVREFLVTHVHRDHYTQAVALRREFGSTVSLGEGERASLEAIHTATQRPEIPALRAAGAPDLSRQVEQWRGVANLDDWPYPDRWLDNGIDIPLKTRSLRVIATPGHTRGHVIFHDVAAKVLFAGDHVLPHITPSIGYEPARPSSPLRDYLTSLQLVRALPDAMLLPAHGPVTASVHARVDELLAHHEARLAATFDRVVTGASTGFEVASGLTWTRREQRFTDLDVFNQVLAVHETMAHLEVLVERGVVTKFVTDGVVHFAAEMGTVTVLAGSSLDLHRLARRLKRTGYATSATARGLHVSKPGGEPVVTVSLVDGSNLSHQMITGVPELIGTRPKVGLTFAFEGPFGQSPARSTVVDIARCVASLAPLAVLNDHAGNLYLVNPNEGLVPTGDIQPGRGNSAASMMLRRLFGGGGR